MVIIAVMFIAADYLDPWPLGRLHSLDDVVLLGLSAVAYPLSSTKWVASWKPTATIWRALWVYACVFVCEIVREWMSVCEIESESSLWKPNPLLLSLPPSSMVSLPVIRECLYVRVRVSHPFENQIPCFCLYLHRPWSVCPWSVNVCMWEWEWVIPLKTKSPASVFTSIVHGQSARDPWMSVCEIESESSLWKPNPLLLSLPPSSMVSLPVIRECLYVRLRVSHPFENQIPCFCLYLHRPWSVCPWSVNVCMWEWEWVIPLKTKSPASVFTSIVHGQSARDPWMSVCESESESSLWKPNPLLLSLPPSSMVSLPVIRECFLNFVCRSLYGFLALSLIRS